MIETPNTTEAEELFDDDVPLAGAEIRVAYEAALGRYILLFNQMDNLLGKVLRTVLKRIGREDLISDFVDKADFSQRVRALDLLKCSAEGASIAAISPDNLRCISGERNILAHAHFEQNPFSGEYWLVNKKEGAHQNYTSARIEASADRIMEVCNALRSMEARFIFINTPIVI